MEKLRDPSHVRALTVEELEAIVMESGLRILDRSSYKLEMELERQLASSFPMKGDVESIREMFRADLRTDSNGER